MGKKKNRFRKLTKKEEEDFGRLKTNLPSLSYPQK